MLPLLQIPFGCCRQCWCILHIAWLDAYNIWILEFVHVEKYLIFFLIPKAWTIYDIAFSTCAKTKSFPSQHDTWICALFAVRTNKSKKVSIRLCLCRWLDEKCVAFYSLATCFTNECEYSERVPQSHLFWQNQTHEKRQIEKKVQRDPNEYNGSHSNIEWMKWSMYVH